MERIYITGIGIVSSIGIGKEKFWQALKEGKSGIKEVSLFDTSLLKVKKAAEITDFKPEEFLGVKGLRTLDRTTKLLLYASKLALEDSGIDVSKLDSNRIAISIGSTLGSLWSISKFDRDAFIEGPHFVNPAEFPNTVINSAPSQVAIYFNIKGPCSTICGAFTSSIEAIKYGISLIEDNHVDIAIVGGVEEFCEQTYLGFYKTGFLAGINGLEIMCPFDKRRNGIIFGEGSAVFVLEKESSLKRKVNRYGYIRGLGSFFYPYAIGKYEPEGIGLKKAINSALEEASLTVSEINYICSTANSTDIDRIETQVIKNIFGEFASKVPISSIKSMVGETFSASGALALAASLGAMQNDFIPPTINYLEKDNFCDLDYVPNVYRIGSVRNVLVNSVDFSGNNSCLIVSSF